MKNHCCICCMSRDQALFCIQRYLILGQCIANTEIKECFLIDLKFFFKENVVVFLNHQILGFNFNHNTSTLFFHKIKLIFWFVQYNTYFNSKPKDNFVQTIPLKDMPIACPPLPLSAVHAERLSGPRHLRPVQRGSQHTELGLGPALYISSCQTVPLNAQTQAWIM